MTGYYKMARGWHDSEMFLDSAFDERSAWSWLISEARWQDGVVSVNGKPHPIKRGQVYASVRFMAEKFKWSKDRVTRFLKRAEQWGMISTDTRTGQNLITICNYSRYQDTKDDTKDSPVDTNKDAHKDSNKDKQEESKEGKEIYIHTAREAVLLWNEAAKRVGLPVCQSISESRLSKLAKRLDEVGGLQGWRDVLAIVEASDFLSGRKTDFRAGIDFLLRPSSLAKVMEGVYNNHTPVRKTAGQQREDDLFEATLNVVKQQRGIA